MSRWRNRWVLTAFLGVLLGGAWFVWAAGISSVPIPTVIRTIDGAVSGIFKTVRVSNGSLTNEGGGVATIDVGIGGTGDASTSEVISIDGQVMVFDGVSGKIAKIYEGAAGILKTDADGVASPALADTDYQSALTPLTDNQLWLGSTGNPPVARSLTGALPITVTPVAGGLEFGATDAGADGATKGVATFTASDFNAALGVVSIDYQNGQAASGATKGFLTAADHATFSAKQNALTAGVDYQTPIASADVIAVFNGGACISGYLKWDGTCDTPPNTGHTIADESAPLAARATLNFLGAGVSCVDNVGGSTDCTISGASVSDAAADGVTKGIATFTAASFNAVAGVIDLDYANGQKANDEQPGFLSAADWNTFASKLPSTGGTGLVAQLVGSTAGRTLQGTTNEIEISNADGVGGNPVIGVPTNAQLSIAKILNLTGNGPVVTTGSDGTLGVSAQVLTQTGLTWNVTAATCTGDANGGTLTVNGANQIVCAGDDGGGGGTAFSALTSAENTTATMQVGTGASLAPSGTGTVTANRLTTGGAGLVEVDGSSVPSPAEAADVVAIFGGGTCSGYLKSDGSCDTPSSGAGILYCGAGGGPDTYTCDLTPDIVAYAAGQCFNFLATTGTTGTPTPTLNVDTLGAVTLKKRVGGVSANLTTDIGDGQMVTACHDGTDLQVQSMSDSAAVAKLVGGGSQQMTGTRLTQRVQTLTITDGAASVPGPETADMASNTDVIPGGGGLVTFGAPAGTPTNGETLTLQLRSQQTDQVPTSWDAIYSNAAGIALPTHTSGTLASPTWDYWKFLYNGTLSKWVLIAIATSTEAIDPGTLVIGELDGSPSGPSPGFTVPNGSLDVSSGTPHLTYLQPNPPSGQTMTNTRITKRVQALTTVAGAPGELTPDCALWDEVAISAQANALSVLAPTCTPTEGQYLTLYVRSPTDQTHTLTWATGASAFDYDTTEHEIPYPTATVLNAALGVQVRWNSVTSRWALVARTVGVLPASQDAPYVITQAAAGYTGATNLGVGATGLVRATVSAGVATIDTLPVPTNFALVTKALTDATPVNLFTLAAAADTGSTVRIEYQIEVLTATNDIQIEDGVVFCRVINQNGVLSLNSCTKTSSQSLGTGTLTIVFAISAANPAQITVNADTSLTPSAGYPKVRYTALSLGDQLITFQ